VQCGSSTSRSTAVSEPESGVADPPVRARSARLGQATFPVVYDKILGQSFSYVCVFVDIRPSVIRGCLCMKANCLRILGVTRSWVSVCGCFVGLRLIRILSVVTPFVIVPTSSTLAVQRSPLGACY